jgi:hypothetical protein
LDVLHAPPRPLGPEIGLHALAENRGIDRGGPVTVPGFNPDHDISAAARMPRCVFRFAVRHTQNVPGDRALCFFGGQVKAGLPLDPVRLIVRRCVEYRRHQLCQFLWVPAGASQLDGKGHGCSLARPGRSARASGAPRAGCSSQKASLIAQGRPASKLTMLAHACASLSEGGPVQESPGLGARFPVIGGTTA